MTFEWLADLAVIAVGLAVFACLAVFVVDANLQFHLKKDREG